VLVWRLTRAEHAPGLDGEGARLWGGRWNSPGRAMVYCASSLALAALEVLVHLPPQMRRASGLPPLVAVGLEVSEAAITALTVATGLEDANACRALGDRFLAAQGTLGLWVPSVVIRRERNVVLNPAHPAMTEVRLVVQEPFAMDARLFG
jgi:RES domain-containing protein